MDRRPIQRLYFFRNHKCASVVWGLLLLAFALSSRADGGLSPRFRTLDFEGKAYSYTYIESAEKGGGPILVQSYSPVEGGVANLSLGSSGHAAISPDGGRLEITQPMLVYFDRESSVFVVLSLDWPSERAGTSLDEFVARKLAVLSRFKSGNQGVRPGAGR